MSTQLHALKSRKVLKQLLFPLKLVALLLLLLFKAVLFVYHKVVILAGFKQCFLQPLNRFLIVVHTLTVEFSLLVESGLKLFCLCLILVGLNGEGIEVLLVGLPLLLRLRLKISKLRAQVLELDVAQLLVSVRKFLHLSLHLSLLELQRRNLILALHELFT